MQRPQKELGSARPPAHSTGHGWARLGMDRAGTALTRLPLALAHHSTADVTGGSRSLQRAVK